MSGVDADVQEPELPREARTAWTRSLATPVRAFLDAETSGAIAMVIAVVLAMVWANSPAHNSYSSLWNTTLSIRVGAHALTDSLRGWVNQGLMTLFFLVAGLEAKRELDVGELRERRRLTAPMLSGIGGIVGAGCVYALINAGGSGLHGWGAAISTDTALALGALSLTARAAAPSNPAMPARNLTAVARGLATRLRVFLLTLSIADDLLALLIIAFFYTATVDAPALLVAAAFFAVLLGLRYAPAPWQAPAAMLAAVGLWIALFESGVDPVISGLLIGLGISAYAPSREELDRSVRLTRSFREQPTAQLAYSATASLTSTISLNERLQYRLLPWTNRVIVPLFALANAGVRLHSGVLTGALHSPVTLGIVGAFAVGKPAGIMLCAWLGSRPAFGGQRLIITWPGLAGTAFSAGVTFTAALLIASLAFHGQMLEDAKLGILATAIIGPALSALAFSCARLLPVEVRARQLTSTASQLLDLADDVDPERDHIRGALDAPVTLVEYGDFECPYCVEAVPVINALIERLGDELRYVWRHLPLSDVHPSAQLAAEAAEAAAAQGHYWEMHDRLLADSAELSTVEIHALAQELGLDLDRFESDLHHRRHAARVAADVRSADASDVTGTPTFFVNGRRHEGIYNVEVLTREIQAAAAAARIAARHPAQ
jgi:Na+/H+ antiporter NhaA